jgi:GTP-sensing pleiotropic transcriptional regulator CodY
MAGSDLKQCCFIGISDFSSRCDGPINFCIRPIYMMGFRLGTVITAKNDKRFQEYLISFFIQQGTMAYNQFSYIHRND